MNNKTGRGFLMTIAITAGTVGLDFIKADATNPVGIGLACLAILAIAVREVVKEK